MSLSEQGESKTQQWFVYIARANTERYYVGLSKDPKTRLKDHNLGRGSKFAKEQGPLESYIFQKLFRLSQLQGIVKFRLKGGRMRKSRGSSLVNGFSLL